MKEVGCLPQPCHCQTRFGNPWVMSNEIHLTMNIYYVYILASKKNGTLYIGVTNDIERRIYEHKTKFNANCFTSRYGVSTLVFYEEFNDISEAIRREKSLKSWQRGWKIDLIVGMNPTWRDL